MNVDDEATRQHLYNSGLNDAEIANRLGRDRTTIRSWRVKRGLPARKQTKWHNSITLDRHACRQELYDQGLSDGKIAEACAVSSNAILVWRRTHGLPPNSRPTSKGRDGATVQPTPELKSTCLKLLRRDIGARLLAKVFGLSVKSLDRWRTEMLANEPGLRRTGTAPRKRPRHASGRVYSRMRPDRRRMAFMLYAEGMSDGEIANEMSVSRQVVWEWRNAYFLKSQRLRRSPKKTKRPLPLPISPRSNSLYAMIADAVGRGVAPDVAEDAISDIFLAYEEGDISADEIPSIAAKYRNNAVGLWANKFGARSIDEEIGEDGFTLLDMMQDESSRNWLEEMGATVA